MKMNIAAVSDVERRTTTEGVVEHGSATTYHHTVMTGSNGRPDEYFETLNQMLSRLEHDGGWRVVAIQFPADNGCWITAHLRRVVAPA